MMSLRFLMILVRLDTTNGVAKSRKILEYRVRSNDPARIADPWLSATSHDPTIEERIAARLRSRAP